MPLTDDQKFRLKQAIGQLKYGMLSPTDASRLAAEFIFENSGFTPTPEKNIWRDYDEAMIPATIEMLEKLTK